MRPSSCVGFALFLTFACCEQASSAGGDFHVEDGFETDALDQSVWSTKQIKSGLYHLVPDPRCGTQALAITVNDDEFEENCSDEEPKCQRAEIRTQPAHRATYGQVAWYGFSFKVTGDISAEGSHRFVIGQWKAPFDDSPFLAQRFDDGIFHITVQNNKDQWTVASADGVASVPPESGLTLTLGERPTLPSPRDTWVDMIYRVRTGRTDNVYGPRQEGQIDVWANGHSVVSVRGNIGATLSKPPDTWLIYFKTGIYRKYVPGEVTLYFDEFKIHHYIEEVQPSCN
ncbi:MAG: heparin lyase I family protein [Bauldia sp.]|nr:heparin lyase I family protein [Bauldia sp.]